MVKHPAPGFYKVLTSANLSGDYTGMSNNKNISKL
jgi:hypothetical protein